MTDLPESLQIIAQTQLATLKECCRDSDLGRAESLGLMTVLAASPFVATELARQPQLLTDLLDSGDLARAYDEDELYGRCLAIEAGSDEATLMAALRQLRRREMVRIAWRDLAGLADLAEVMATMTGLADGLTQVALGFTERQLAERHGQAIGRASGKPVGMSVLGLGKLGGGELNFSSDIDLMFVYPEDGDTNGARSISNHEFFIKAGRQLIKLLGETNADGMVFRVDMRLRPNGNSGPLALSFDAMEHYYQVHGREWERYALIKARVIAGDREAGKELLVRLRPFIYRRYVDYGAVESIREMKQLINQELRRKGMTDNVKLGPGGIREIEFIGQAFQLIRGGREPGLQRRSILRVLPLLVDDGLITQLALEDLTRAYDFLRRTEHRLQMIADRQTHVLPVDEPDRSRVAFAMGYADWATFEASLRKNMRKVHGHFEQVFVAPQGEQGEADGSQDWVNLWQGVLDGEPARKLLREAGYQRPDDVCRLIQGLRQGRAYTAFSREGRERMDRLMPLLLAAAVLTAEPETTLARLVHLIEAIGRRSAYLSLLVENPLALSQLVKLFAASAWIADWISRHPVVLDELIGAASLYQDIDRDQLASALKQRMARLPLEDLEAQMEGLREFHHGQVLRVAAAEIGPGLATEAVGKRLSWIAEVVVAQAAAAAAAVLVERHGQPDCRHTETGLPFIVIGYGKLGGSELGYGSDLDLSFLYGDCPLGGMTDGARPVVNEVFFARLGQRLIHILNTRTPAGVLYEVDMRLRPSGQSGPLVTGLEAFRRYQLDKAWTWEHQALVRARPVIGPAALCDGFEVIRKEVLCRPRDPQQLRGEVREMRDKMYAAQERHEPDLFHLKHDPGGIVDIEFMVQYGVLRWAAEHPELTGPRTTAELLAALAGAGKLEPTEASALVDGYRRCITLYNRQNLFALPPLVPQESVQEFVPAVRAVWDRLFAEQE